MILVNNNWEQVNTLQDVSKIIRDNYNEELADEMDELIPTYTDAEFCDLEYTLTRKQEKIDELEEKIDDLERENEKLQDKIDELECH